MTEFVDEHDWAASLFGERDEWPDLLRTTVDIVLATQLPMFVAWGREFRVIYNDAFSAIMGANHPAALARPLSEIWTAEWPILRPVFERTLGGESIYFEDAAFRIRRNGDDEMRYFTFSQTPLRADPTCAPSGLLAICIDTTESVRNRQKLAWQSVDLQEVFREAPGFIGMTLGPEHRFEFVNETYRQMIGGRDVVGKTVAEGMPELVPQGILTLLDQIYETGEPFLSREMPLKLLDEHGELRQKFVNIILKAFRDAQGEVVGVFAEGHDVTERKGAVESIDALQQSLFHASRVAAMGVMATTLAHELNQPLTASANYLRGSRRLVSTLSGANKALTEEGLDEAEQQIHRAGDIIKRVRDMLNERPAAAEPILLEDMVSRVTKVIRSGGGCRNVSIQTEIGIGADKVAADPVQIEQVLLNLFRNACEAIAGTPAGEILIVSRRAHDPSFVMVEVRDNGEGLAEPAALFETFGLSTRGGMGVGLSICRTIIEAHRGHIWARNNPEGGASFFFTLPVAKKIARSRSGTEI